MMGDSRIASVSDGTALIARLESVPFSRWHLRPRIIVGSATFFDAFDALALAFVLPVLVPLWGLSPGQERLAHLDRLPGTVPRRADLRVARGSDWTRARGGGRRRDHVGDEPWLRDGSGSFAVLFVCRFVQGVGVGGEMPVAAVYINELSKARGRGRFFLLYEMIFPIGLMMTGQIGALLVPHVRLAGDVPHRRHSGTGHHLAAAAPARVAALADFEAPLRGSRGDRPRDGSARASPDALRR